jgi:RimJ/RimL family protein N-acetyltransferase
MKIIIREANQSDAEQLIAYVCRLSEELESNIELSPGEFTLTVAQEQKILADFALSDNSVYLVAEVKKKIVGILICNGSNREAVRHVVTINMSVDKMWRGKGVASQLMSQAIEWAKNTGIVSRIELFVLERNKTAIHLYSQFGFQVEGRRQRAMFRNDEYLDDIMMGLLL